MTTTEEDDVILRRFFYGESYSSMPPDDQAWLRRVIFRDAPPIPSVYAPDPWEHLSASTAVTASDLTAAIYPAPASPCLCQ